MLTFPKTNIWICSHPQTPYFMLVIKFGPDGIKKFVRNYKIMLKKEFLELFLGQKLSRKIKKMKMPKQKHIKPYVFLKVRLKCLQNVTIMWFSFSILRNKNSVTFCATSVWRRTDSKNKTTPTIVSHSSKPNKGYTNLGLFCHKPCGRKKEILHF